MILLDTHVWLWWMYNSPEMPKGLLYALDKNKEDGFAVSVISCWEVSKLLQKKRIEIDCSLTDWFNRNAYAPFIHLVDLTPEIIAEAAALPSFPNKDPADQLIVATARDKGFTLATYDRKLSQYPHVALLAY